MTDDALIVRPDNAQGAPREQTVELAQSVAAVSYSGPLPPVEDFERYEAAVPGAGERIIALAEASSERSYEIQIDDNRTTRHVTWSMFAMVAVVALAALVVSLVLVGAGSPLLGSLASTASAVFIGLGVLLTWWRGRRADAD